MDQNGDDINKKNRKYGKEEENETNEKRKKYIDKKNDSAEK